MKYIGLTCLLMVAMSSIEVTPARANPVGDDCFMCIWFATPQGGHWTCPRYEYGGAGCLVTHEGCTLLNPPC